MYGLFLWAKGRKGSSMEDSAVNQQHGKTSGLSISPQHDSTTSPLQLRSNKLYLINRGAVFESCAQRLSGPINSDLEGELNGRQVFSIVWARLRFKTDKGIKRHKGSKPHKTMPWRLKTNLYEHAPFLSGMHPCTYMHTSIYMHAAGLYTTHTHMMWDECAIFI